ncbi:indole-3-glycerol-phosphate synthase [Candidatus Gottesmanbacteria bacterium]|nr:indole-3-glycerol-phosphate synthase [Candidatus Gottesmanbacteria bacterium]
MKITLQDIIQNKKREIGRKQRRFDKVQGLSTLLHDVRQPYKYPQGTLSSSLNEHRPPNFFSSYIQLAGRRSVHAQMDKPFTSKQNLEDIALIAEIKIASPTSGRLGNLADVKEKVSSYELGGADSLSVVVDKKYFGGSFALLQKVRSFSQLPILSKDFVIDKYQVYEAKFHGADAVLLIAKIVSQDKLKMLVKLVRELEMEPVVEVNSLEELRRVLRVNTRIIAVNARNLDDFSLDLDKACRILKRIPQNMVALAFSGVSSRNEIVKYKDAGAKGVLVGTTLMKSKDPAKVIKELKGL